MTPLDDLFMAETMTETVERFADEDNEEMPFLEVFEQDTIRPMTDDFSWDEVVYSRGLAKVTGPSSPTQAARAMGKIKRYGSVYAIKEHVDLDARFILMAKGEGSPLPNPEAELNKNLKNTMRRCKRTLNYWAAQSMLASGGTVDLGGFDNTDLPVGTTLTYPIQSISAGSGAWSNPATPIRADFTTVKRTAKRVSGLPIAEAIASDAVEGYIGENSKVVTLVGGVPTLAQRMIEVGAEEGAITKFGGANWRYHRGFYVTDANEKAGNVETTTDIISDTDLVALLPERSRWGECFAKVEGLVLVKSGPVSQLAVGGALGMLYQARGWVAYVTLQENPLRFRLHVEWVGNLVHKVQKAATRFNVSP